MKSEYPGDYVSKLGLRIVFIKSNSDEHGRWVSFAVDSRSNLARLFMDALQVTLEQVSVALKLKFELKKVQKNNLLSFKSSKPLMNTVKHYLDLKSDGFLQGWLGSETILMNTFARVWHYGRSGGINAKEGRKKQKEPWKHGRSNSTGKGAAMAKKEKTQSHL